MQTKQEALNKLAHSKFRSSFHLKQKDRAYVNEKGYEKLTEHAREFVHERLSASYIKNDGKQTPMKGHPVFIAQHATATCCRGCLYKWYGVKEHTTLTPTQEDKIVNLIMYWIRVEMENGNAD